MCKHLPTHLIIKIETRANSEIKKKKHNKLFPTVGDYWHGRFSPTKVTSGRGPGGEAHIIKYA